MPVIRRIHCTKCSQPVDPNLQCQACGQTHGRSRGRERQRLSGRNTAAWKRLAAAAKAAQPWCSICKATDDLTVDHLRYPAVTLADVRVACRSCNGRDGALRGQANMRKR